MSQQHHIPHDNTRILYPPIAGVDDRLVLELNAAPGSSVHLLVGHYEDQGASIILVSEASGFVQAKTLIGALLQILSPQRQHMRGLQVGVNTRIMSQQDRPKALELTAKAGPVHINVSESPADCVPRFFVEIRDAAKRTPESWFQEHPPGVFVFGHGGPTLFGSLRTAALHANVSEILELTQR